MCPETCAPAFAPPQRCRRLAWPRTDYDSPGGPSKTLSGPLSHAPSSSVPYPEGLPWGRPTRGIPFLRSRKQSFPGDVAKGRGDQAEPKPPPPVNSIHSFSASSFNKWKLNAYYVP